MSPGFTNVYRASLLRFPQWFFQNFVYLSTLGVMGLGVVLGYNTLSQQPGRTVNAFVTIETHSGAVVSNMSGGIQVIAGATARGDIYTTSGSFIQGRLSNPNCVITATGAIQRCAYEGAVIASRYLAGGGGGGTTYTAGQGLVLNGTSFKVNSTLSGSLLRFTTVSGSTVYGRNAVTSSGAIYARGANPSISMLLNNGTEILANDKDQFDWYNSWDGSTAADFQFNQSTGNFYEFGSSLGAPFYQFSDTPSVSATNVDFYAFGGSHVLDYTSYPYKSQMTFYDQNGLMGFDMTASGASGGRSLMRFRGQMSGSTLTVSDRKSCTLLYTNSRGNVFCGGSGSGGGVGTTYTAGQGLTLASNSFSLSSSFSGSLLTLRAAAPNNATVSQNWLSNDGRVTARMNSSGSLVMSGRLIVQLPVSHDPDGSPVPVSDYDMARFIGTHSGSFLGVLIQNSSTFNATSDLYVQNSAASDLTGFADLAFTSQTYKVPNGGEVGPSQGVLFTGNSDLNFVSGKPTGAIKFALTDLSATTQLQVPVTAEVMRLVRGKVGIMTQSGYKLKATLTVNGSGAFTGNMSGNNLNLQGRRNQLVVGISTTGSLVSPKIAQNTVIGRVAAGVGPPVALTQTQLRTLAVAGNPQDVLYNNAGSMDGDDNFQFNARGMVTIDQKVGGHLEQGSLTVNINDQALPGTVLYMSTVGQVQDTLQMRTQGGNENFYTVNWAGRTDVGQTFAGTQDAAFTINAQDYATVASAGKPSALVLYGIEGADDAFSVWNQAGTRNFYVTTPGDVYSNGLINVAGSASFGSVNDGGTMDIASTTNINGTLNANAGLIVSGASIISGGETVAAGDFLASAGNVTAVGNLSGQTLTLSQRRNCTLLYTNPKGTTFCGGSGSGGGVGTTYAAGQGLTLSSTSFKTNATLSGTLIRFLTVSGSTVLANTRLNSSGTLSVDGTARLRGNINVLGTVSGALLTLNGSATGNNYVLGNLGIGKTTPRTKLEINGTLSGTNLLAMQALNSSGTLSVQGAAYFRNNLTTTGSTVSFTNSLPNGSYVMKIQDTQNAGEFIQAVGRNNTKEWDVQSTANGDGEMHVYRSDGADQARISGQSADYFLQNVGIGTLNPHAVLDVIGTMSGQGLRIGGAKGKITRLLTATGTLAFGSLGSAGCEDLTMTVTGATVATSVNAGDTVSLAIPNGSVPSATFFFPTPWVSAANVVTIRGCAIVSGSPASGVFGVEVHHFANGL